MERMQLEYNKAAEDKGVYIISACGFDSIPADMGLMYFIQQFKGMVQLVLTTYFFPVNFPRNSHVLGSESERKGFT